MAKVVSRINEDGRHHVDFNISAVMMDKVMAGDPKASAHLKQLVVLAVETLRSRGKKPN